MATEVASPPWPACGRRRHPEVGYLPERWLRRGFAQQLIRREGMVGADHAHRPGIQVSLLLQLHHVDDRFFEVGAGRDRAVALEQRHLAVTSERLSHAAAVLVRS